MAFLPALLVCWAIIQLGISTQEMETTTVDIAEAEAEPFGSLDDNESYSRCGDPPYVKNATLSASEDGQFTLYMCDEGMIQAAGDSEKVCLDNGTWVGVDLVCVHSPCPKPNNVPFTEQTASEDGMHVKYTCIGGFKHIHNEGKATCDPINKTWTEIKDPLCDVVECGPPPEFEGVHLDVQSTDYSSIALYNCLDGKRFGAKTCGQDGSWTGPDPDCTDLASDNIPAEEHEEEASESDFPNEAAHKSSGVVFHQNRAFALVPHLLTLLYGLTGF